MEDKITEILERFSRIFKAMQWDTIKKYKISPIQAQFLIYLNKFGEKQCSVSNLSREFGLKLSTVSDAISSIERKGYLTKKRNPKDKRNFYLKLTKKGKELELKIRKWNEKFKNSLKILSDEEKEKLYGLMLMLLMALQKKGFLLDFQICFSCKYFKIQNTNGSNYYFCKLTNKELVFKDFKFDCGFFVSAKKRFLI